MCGYGQKVTLVKNWVNYMSRIGVKMLLVLLERTIKAIPSTVYSSVELLKFSSCIESVELRR